MRKASTSSCPSPSRSSARDASSVVRIARASSSSVAASEAVTTQSAASKSGATRFRDATPTETLSPSQASPVGFVTASLTTFKRGAACTAAASKRQSGSNQTRRIGLNILNLGIRRAAATRLRRQQYRERKRAGQCPLRTEEN